MKEVIRMYNPSTVVDYTQSLLDKGCEVKHMVTAGSDHRFIIVIFLVPPGIEI